MTYKGYVSKDIPKTANSPPELAEEKPDPRLKRLENTHLRLLDDQPTPGNIVKPNLHGATKGYSPYDSGMLVGKKEVSRKKDLRKLSEWLQLRKQASTNKDDE